MMLFKHYNRYHEGQPGYIIGGGPSLQSISSQDSFTQLHTRLTFGVNRAYILLPLTYLIIGDMWFWKTYLHEFKDLPCVKFVPEFCPKSQAQQVVPVRRSFDRKCYVPENAAQPIPFMNNTGVAALRIAYVLGCDPLYLLGFDLRAKNHEGKTHWHEGYTCVRNAAQARYVQFIDVFTKTIVEMQRRGRRIISCTPDSPLNAICPFQELQETFV